MKPRIVILGAGFGGVYAAKRFSRLAEKNLIDLTIVNRTNYFLFTPLLHEVATGGLSPRVVAEPIRHILRGSPIRIIQASIASIDSEKKNVTVNTHYGAQRLDYDYLVIATGAETNYYNIPGAAEQTLPLKNLADAVAIRSKIIDSFEEASLAPFGEMRQEMLNFVVVGGGATGVEMAAELAEFTTEIANRYYKTKKRLLGHVAAPMNPTVTLAYAGKELLETFPARLRRSAAKRLTKQGVVLKSGVQVTNVTENKISFDDGSSVAGHTVIWSAGVKATIPQFTSKSPSLSGGRIMLDRYCRAQSFTDIFVIGDAGAYVDPKLFRKDSSETRALPMLAQVAVSQAALVVDNIVASVRGRQMREFHYASKGALVSLGKWHAVGELYSLKVTGALAWWIWRTVYLWKFGSWQKRLRIAIEWTLDFFYARDITKLD